MPLKECWIGDGPEINRLSIQVRIGLLKCLRVAPQVAEPMMTPTRKATITKLRNIQPHLLCLRIAALQRFKKPQIDLKNTKRKFIRNIYYSICTVRFRKLMIRPHNPALPGVSDKQLCSFTIDNNMRPSVPECNELEIN